MTAEPRVRLRVVCCGVVQGVGMRPALHRLATALALGGTIDNCSGRVELDLCGPRGALEQLLVQLPVALPPQAQLESMSIAWLPSGGDGPTDLRIGVSPAEPLGAGWVAPALVSDRAPCLACRAELADPSSRRYRYPFISCCACGPRFSIATAEPFARANTSLAAFPMCSACQQDFDDPENRRFHAETISCPRCGPRLQWLAVGRPSPTMSDPLGQALAVLRRGGIVALLGVGGFQLLVDATDAAAVERLRRRKQRPAKPLAVLVAALDQLEPWLQMSAIERELLQSPQAPIVLLQRRPALAGSTPSPETGAVAPGSPALGVMLPASPLHLLLAQALGRPLVATSGNRSGEPLCHTREQALAQLADPAAPIADGLLLHDRTVVRPLDDSLLQCIEGHPQMLRRARGYAPSPLMLPNWPSATAATLALGGDLKAAPALALGDGIWMAPHQGDLSTARNHGRWQRGLESLLERYGSCLESICSDRHPHQSSVQWAQHCCERFQLRHCRVQHHRAHALAVLAEHGLKPPALVLAFDGLGLGDGPEPLWGCEGLRLDAAGESTRLASLRPFALPGGDRAALEPRRAALGLLHSCGGGVLEHPGARATRDAFAAAELPLLLQALSTQRLCPRSSSAGRLFDAVASLLDLVQRRSYDGQGGLLLQGVAEAARARGETEPYPLPLVQAPAGRDVQHWWDWQPLLEALLADCAAGVDAGVCALRFHRAWLPAVIAWVVRQPPRPVVLCGGCFQNRLLLEGLIAALRQHGRQPLWAQQLPPGDGGLALGQLLAARLDSTGVDAALQQVCGA